MDRTPGFQGDIEATRGGKLQVQGRVWGLLPQASAFLAASALGWRVRVVPGLETGAVSLPGGHPKVARRHRQMGTGCQAFRKTLRQPGEKSGEAEEEAGVLPRRLVSSWQPLRRAWGAHGVTGLHPGCLSLPRGSTQSGKKASRGWGQDTRLSGVHLGSLGRKAARPRRRLVFSLGIQ